MEEENKMIAYPSRRSVVILLRQHNHIQVHTQTPVDIRAHPRWDVSPILASSIRVLWRQKLVVASPQIPWIHSLSKSAPSMSTSSPSVSSKAMESSHHKQRHPCTIRSCLLLPFAPTHRHSLHVVPVPGYEMRHRVCQLFVIVERNPRDLLSTRIVRVRRLSPALAPSLP
ncbi:hypothetical protein ARMSODRAFT_678951 [Armillaria solidipes]|uniref:Uncharacterized protein n=1 Tax=Armillaria solidipes TaxID=1076256 RepID=A0A2H3ATD4_9AGAR|nr:hypothetical protein ARMSODRAFT_678951 [Armillaria solidipes]